MGRSSLPRPPFLTFQFSRKPVFQRGGPLPGRSGGTHDEKNEIAKVTSGHLTPGGWAQQCAAISASSANAALSRCGILVSGLPPSRGKNGQTSRCGSSGGAQICDIQATQQWNRPAWT